MVESPPEFPLVEVQRHCVREDAWLVVDGTVYDVTDWVAVHPGGPEILLSCAGLDATQEFEDVGHSGEARGQLASMAVGRLREATAAEWADAAAEVDVQHGAANAIPASALCRIGPKRAMISGGERGAGYVSAAWAKVIDVLPARRNMLAATGAAALVALFLRRVVWVRPN